MVGARLHITKECCVFKERVALRGGILCLDNCRHVNRVLDIIKYNLACEYAAECRVMFQRAASCLICNTETGSSYVCMHMGDVWNR